MAVRYKEAVDEMYQQNKEAFNAFKPIHDLYAQNPEKYQDDFNEKGRIISDILRRAENKLCGKSERGSFGKYSQNLADKFREEVKKTYPKIDFVGVKIS
jgi:hypothetical protein